MTVKKIVLFLTMSICLISAYAQGFEVSIENINYKKGVAGQFDICFKTSERLYDAYQAYVYLPEGLNLAESKKDVLLDGEAVEDNDMAYTWVEGADAAPDMVGFRNFMLTAIDTDTGTIPTTEGKCVLSIRYLASNIEELEVVLKNVVLTTPDGDSNKSVVVDEITASGKADGDGPEFAADNLEVGISDLDYQKGVDGEFNICFTTGRDEYDAYQAYVYLPVGLNLSEEMGEILADGEAVTADNEVTYTWIADAAEVPGMAGYRKFLLRAGDTGHKVIPTSGGKSVLRVKYLASELDNVHVVLRDIRLMAADGDVKKTLTVSEVRASVEPEEESPWDKSKDFEVLIKNIYYEKGVPGEFDVCFRTKEAKFSAYQAFLYLPVGLNLESKKKYIIENGSAVADNDMAYKWTPGADAAPDMEGFQKFFIAAYDSEAGVMATTDGKPVFKIKYLASDIDELEVVLKRVTLAVPSGDPTQSLVVEEVSSKSASNVAVKSVSLDQVEVSLYANETVQLTAVTRPLNATRDRVVWSSDNVEVAVVDESGLVTALKPGTAVISATSTDGTDLTASCRITCLARQYSVKFIADGVTLSEGMQDCGSAIVAPEVPAKVGYTFAGWSPVLDETVPEHDVIYTAQFTINHYTISFDCDGGSVVEPVTLDYNAVVMVPENPTRTGYTFVGWDREIPETMPAENILVKALWTVNSYKLTYMLESVELVQSSVEFGAAIVPVDAPEKTGYSFGGWEGLPEFMPAADVVVTGNYNINSYKLTYVVDGEVYKVYDVEYNSVITPERKPKKPEWDFGGWSEIPAVMPANDVVVTGEFNIYTGLDSVGGLRTDRRVYNIQGQGTGRVTRGLNVVDGRILLVR